MVAASNRPLIDGSVTRLPSIRVQAEDGQTIEMHPRPVDVLVERLAGETDSGRDTQLDRAIQELLPQFGRKS